MVVPFGAALAVMVPPAIVPMAMTALPALPIAIVMMIVGLRRRYRDDGGDEAERGNDSLSEFHDLSCVARTRGFQQEGRIERFLVPSRNEWAGGTQYLRGWVAAAEP